MTLVAAGALAALLPPSAYAQDYNLNPTRPTIANAVTIQSPGVLQVETGYDAYPQSTPGNQQTVATNFFYSVLPRLRLDFGWSSFQHQQQGADSTNGTGDISLGGKVVLRQEHYHRPMPGFAVQYEAELPTANQDALQSYGQQAIFLTNHHYGPNGDIDVILNASIVQSGCQSSTGCVYGGQQSLALSFHEQKSTRLYAEAFAQNVAASNTPPGTYIFGGFYHQYAQNFGLDGGLRFGVSNHSASIGTTVGLVFGKRVHAEPDTKPNEQDVNTNFLRPRPH
ncbi:hypothetical protein D1Y84_10460 [Acidipila sp. EB88]|nr:hypothetical protein D1Y84_10460 [Acidipila sp. EB88]